jgi:hypothetical protein
VSLTEGDGAGFSVYPGLSFTTPTALTSGMAFDFTVGNSGLIAFGAFFNCGDDCGSIDYSVSLSTRQPQTPVPLAPTAALIGAGAVAMGLRRRKHGAR